MILEILLQFSGDLLRALLLDELSERVRGLLAASISRRQELRRRQFYDYLRSRPSRALLHKMRTTVEEDVR